MVEIWEKKGKYEKFLTFSYFALYSFHHEKNDERESSHGRADALKIGRCAQVQSFDDREIQALD